MYKKDDKVIFKVGEESFEYTVVKNYNNCWFLAVSAYFNSIIFTKLNIVDRFEFVKNISKYVTDNTDASFPEIKYPDETEINKVIDALLEKCDEYNKLNRTTICYNRGDTIVFKLPDIQYKYSIKRTSSGRWFLTHHGGLNSRIFGALNITDKMQFCKDVSGCNISLGDFPEIQCPNSTGISKVINKLMEMCEEKMKESLKAEKELSTETTSQKPSFKEGDYVKVISKEDVKGCGCYRFGFTEGMFNYCGNIYTICNVSRSQSKAQSEPDDGMLYKLKTVNGTVLPFNFASSMLIGTDIIPPQLHSFETKEVLKKSTPEYKLKFTN